MISNFFNANLRVGGWGWKGSISVVQLHLNRIASGRVDRRHSFPDLDPRLVSDHGDDDVDDVGDDDYLHSWPRIFQCDISVT